MPVGSQSVIIQPKSSLGIISGITDNFHSRGGIIDPKLRFDHARAANVRAAHRNADAIVPAPDAARETERRLDLYLLATSTAAESHGGVAEPSVVANIVKVNVIKVKDGHVVHNGQLGTGSSAAPALGRLHTGIVPLNAILPHDDAGDWGTQRRNNEIKMSGCDV